MQAIQGFLTIVQSDCQNVELAFQSFVKTIAYQGLDQLLYLYPLTNDPTIFYRPPWFGTEVPNNVMGGSWAAGRPRSPLRRDPTREYALRHPPHGGVGGG